MLTEQDIKLLTDVFATKEDLEKFREEMRENFSNQLSAIDAYAKKADAYFQEMVVLTHRVDRLENWAQKISNKLGIRLEF